MQIIFNTLTRKSVFVDDFKDLKQNNIIEFNENKIVVVYGPNGTGKTSLAKVLQQEAGAKYSINIDDKEYKEDKPKIAHIISDQNDRNIIAGSTEDFILGDNIKREYELKAFLDLGFKTLFENTIGGVLKSQYGISKVKTPFGSIVKDQNIKEYISDISNKNSKGSKIDKAKFIKTISSMKPIEVPSYSNEKLQFVISDYKSEDSLIRNILSQRFELKKGEIHLEKIEQSADALWLLDKYSGLSECIVCDSGINHAELLIKKQTQKERAIQSLSEEAKKILDEIISKVPQDDPFNIVTTLKNALVNFNLSIINELKDELSQYLTICEMLIVNIFIYAVRDCSLQEKFSEYEALVKDKPEFEHEDILFIERFLNECLEKKISLKRDQNNNLKLLLGDAEFLNSDRKSLSLSNGEQNFLSLSFELLKAKKSSENIIVLDDPISSFDSIYKNKISYALIKFLEDKKTIVLTHNTDLIKLLEHQVNKCYKMYFLNNTNGENNGFISVNTNEVDILLYIHKLIDLLRTEIKTEILDEKRFLIAITPFMRGYCQIIGDIDSKNALTKVMHGYENEKVNLAEIYNKIFRSTLFSADHSVSATDIIDLNDDAKIIKSESYPLLSKTIHHTFTYLFLRLKVENVLVNKFNINTTKYSMLSQIIVKSFNGKSKDELQNRVFFLSRKTLLNEFNHFEMDMNIFQPAIDITNTVLLREKREIIEKLQTIAT